MLPRNCIGRSAIGMLITVSWLIGGASILMARTATSGLAFTVPAATKPGEIKPRYPGKLKNSVQHPIYRA